MQYSDRNREHDGYRPNVGIILFNHKNKVFWARRCGHDGWQFPQGGIRLYETVEQALYRELEEEVGLRPDHVKVIARTQDWLHYDLPDSFLKRLRHKSTRNFRGQKQIWYLLRLIGDDSQVHLDASRKPEFDDWVWKDWAAAVEEIIGFKRHVYRTAFYELKVHLPAGPFLRS